MHIEFMELEIAEKYLFATKFTICPSIAWKMIYKISGSDHVDDPPLGIVIKYFSEPNPII